MKRGRKKHRLSHIPHTYTFSLKNNPMILFLVLTIWVGISAGIMAYSMLLQLDSSMVQAWGMGLGMTDASLDWRSVLSVSFWWLLVLFALFLSGMCTFGGPLIFGILMLGGFRIGIDQCGVLQHHGWLSAAVYVCVPSMIYVASMVGLGHQTLALSVRLTRSLLANRYGTLWCEFRRTLIGLLITTPLVLLTAVLQIGLMMTGL